MAMGPKGGHAKPNHHPPHNHGTPKNTSSAPKGHRPAPHTPPGTGHNDRNKPC